VEILRWQVGDATILRIREVDATAALLGLIPKLDPAAVSRAAWLTPNFVDEMGRLRGLVQAFLIIIEGRTIIVDPGVGNWKRRIAVPGWNNMHTDFLDRLRDTGVELDEIGFVGNFDHVGWHTRLIDGAWRPTFPAAHYVMSAEEFRYWQSTPNNVIADQLAGFSDSVLPVYNAGLVDLVADDHVVTEGVRLMPSPGHTPHHVSVLVESGGQSAVITGDVMHHPCQIAYPDWGASDFDASQAQASRLDLIERFADSESLIIGTHFADPVAGCIRREGTTFRLVPAEE
jgi:glyoxylase-like metal-dependent hydrolase (beta-lactamase superfamily II)